MVVVGTGVSAAISNSPTATWKGLLSSGTARLEGISSPALLQNIRNNIEFGFDSDDLSSVLHAADRLKSELDSVGAAAMKKWLNDDIGSLPVLNPRLGEALRALPFPILTTNYDTLLSTSDRRAVTWRDHEALQGIMAGTSRDIGHLHGAWEDSASIVLSSTDYDTLLKADAFQTLQRSVHSLKSLVYVGYGAGLSDPNFGRLIRLHSAQFAGGQVKHFRLCRSSELERLEREHLGDHIIPVSYGDEYEDLPAFIEAMSGSVQDATVSPVGIVRDLAGDACATLSETLISESIIAETREGDDQPSFHDVVLPPVLLPVPHAEFIKAQNERTDGSQQVSRTDPFDDARNNEVILLVGEEGSGLSTASKWLALEAASHVGGAIPVIVSYRQVGNGPRPLHRLIGTTARSHGWVSGPSDPMPGHVLVVDDYSPYVRKISDRAISDFAASDALVRIITCALGAEDDVVEKLNALGVEFSIRYLGKLGRRDIEKYARAASPVGYTDITERVVDILTAESLARTPYTVGLLISVLMRGTTLTANASQTTVLDDYVGALLGRGDPHEDARLGLDQSSREALLSAFAKHFVISNTGGVLEPDAVLAFQDALTRLSWSESPTEVLQSLIDRRVLSRTGGRIVFARSSFLHLFAAKRAIQDPEFRDHLLKDPLYYAQIIGDYAALNRHDSALVDHLNLLLVGGEWETDAGGVFSEIDILDGPVLLEADPTHHSTPNVEAPAAELDPFEMTSDGDTTPFPTTQHEQLPPALRLMRVLELVSNVLRDSDQIEDGAKKQEVLRNVLEHWGHLMNTLEQDPDFKRFVQELGERLYAREVDEEFGEEGDAAAKASQRAELLEELGLLFPAAIALGSLTEHLASRRLVRPLSHVASAAQDDERLEITIAAAFMIYSVKERGWPEALQDLIARRKNIWVIRNFLLPLLMSDWVGRNVASEDEDDLLQLCLDIALRSFRYESDAQRVAHREQIRQSLKRERLERSTSAAHPSEVGELS